MYICACVSHLSFIGPIFTVTVSLVVANGLQAFFWWHFLLGGPFRAYHRLISYFGVVLGIVVSISCILFVQNLEVFAPVAGFYTLSLVQPPFVFLGLCSAAHIYFSNHPRDPGSKFLFIGGSLLMFAMAISAVETFIDPFLLGTVTTTIETFENPSRTVVVPSFTGLGGFPLLHILIHIFEQIGIYLYGMGCAWVHLRFVVGRKDIKFRCSSFGWFWYVETYSNATNDDRQSEIMDEKNLKDFSLDLLAKSPRVFPEQFNVEVRKAYPRMICSVLGEPSPCIAVHDCDEIKSILKDIHSFSSNPYPDERLIGLSTTDGPRHDIQRKIANKFFSSKKLNELEETTKVFSFIAKEITNRFIISKGGDLVEDWGYPIVVTSGLVALGIPIDDLFSEKEFKVSGLGTSFSNGFQLIKGIAQWSRDAVRLVAPVGGMGPCNGITIQQFISFLKTLFISIPMTLKLIYSVGIQTTWHLLRPDLIMVRSQFFPYYSHVDSKSASCPRTGMFMYPNSISEIPKYFLTIRSLWIHFGKLYPHTFLGELLIAKENGSLTEAECLLLLVQCLVSMTTVNALVNSIVMLIDPNIHTLPPEALKKGNDTKRVSIASQVAQEAIKTAKSLWNESENHDGVPSMETVSKFIDLSLLAFPPLQRLPRRIIAKNANIHGQQISFGTHVMLLLGAANQQLLEEHHSKDLNDNVDPTATSSSSSLTFGLGVHRCLGEELVRMEMRTSILAWCVAMRGRKIIPVGHGKDRRLWTVDVGNYGFEEFSMIVK